MIIAQWPVPSTIRLISTTRNYPEGVSLPPYDRFNLGGHVGDDAEHVAQNRQLLEKRAKLPESPMYLNQTHSTFALDLATVQSSGLSKRVNADAVYSSEPNRVCCIMTADCLPVAFCNQNGTEIAAAHAGWRGLHGGVLENTIAHFQSPSEEIVAWLGPAISQSAFEVGKEVREMFIEAQFAIDRRSIKPIQDAFIINPSNPERYLADIYQLARIRLQSIGVHRIYGGDHCTYRESAQFFSYRRQAKTGRQATLIWRT